LSRHYSKKDLRTLVLNGLGAELEAPKPPRKNDEFQLQCALIAWWSEACKGFGVPEALLWHTPNSAVYGGSKENREKIGAMLKRIGQRSGVPDLALMVPRKGSPVETTLHGLFLELKAPNGVVSPEQKQVLALLTAHGYSAVVCRTLDEAKAAITNYLE